jgi:peptidoglycan/LPS O-acetylase OafA/YrhL
MATQKRDVEWADVRSVLRCSADRQGIRGIASLFIVTSHSIRAFLPTYLYPADSPDATPHLFQLPFIRIVAAGPFWISIFFLLSGYVCAVKPIRLSNAGQVDESRRVIASSAFRRVLRIGLPATLGTLMAWVLCQLGVYELHPDVHYWSGWLENSRPQRRSGFLGEVQNLFRQCVRPRDDSC